MQLSLGQKKLKSWFTSLTGSIFSHKIKMIDPDIMILKTRFKGINQKVKFTGNCKVRAPRRPSKNFKKKKKKWQGSRVHFHRQRSCKPRHLVLLAL